MIIGIITMGEMKEWYGSVVEGLGAPGTSNPVLKGRPLTKWWSRLDDGKCMLWSFLHLVEFF